MDVIYPALVNPAAVKVTDGERRADTFFPVFFPYPFWCIPLKSGVKAQPDAHH